MFHVKHWALGLLLMLGAAQAAPLPALPDAGSNADLGSIATTDAPNGVQRCGYLVPGDSPCVTFIPSSSACSITSFQGDVTTAVIPTTQLNVTSVTSGSLRKGLVMPAGGIFPAGVTVTRQISGTAGGIGVYELSEPFSPPGSFTLIVKGDGGLQVPSADAKCFISNAPSTPETWGAVGDGSTDDSIALNAALSAVGYVELGAGKTYAYANPLLITKDHRRISCPVLKNCILKYTGTSTTTTPILIASDSGPFGASDIIKIQGGAAAGYAPADTVTLADGCGTHAVITIATVAAGVPTSARITTMGSCTTRPAFNVTQASTTGGGTGVTFDMFYGSLGTQIFNPMLERIVLTSTTTMTESPFIRFDFTSGLQTQNLRVFGNDTIYQGIAVSRGLTNNFFDTSIEHTLAEQILLSGTDNSTNGNIDTHFRNFYTIACNSAIASKVAAQATGCIRVGDNVGGLFVDDKLEAYQHKGYAVYFGPTLGHTGGNNLSSLAHLNGLNVEATGDYAGSIGGGNWTNLTIGGPASWLTGINIDTVDMSSGTFSDVKINSQIYSSQTDASEPSALNWNGSLLNLYGSEVGCLTSGTIGIKWGTSAASVSNNSSSVLNCTKGLVGTTGTGGAKNFNGMAFYNNTTDLSGISCIDISGPVQARSSAGGQLCRNSTVLQVTRDVSLASGSQAITGVGFTPTRCRAFGAVDATTFALGYITMMGAVDLAGTTGSMLAFGGSQVFNAGGNFLYFGNAGDHSTAALTSFDTDGITLAWTKVGAPTGTAKITLECER